MGVSKTEYLTLIRILGCLTMSLGVNEGHQEDGKVSWPRQVPSSFPLSLSEHIWLRLSASLFSWKEAVSRMQICELWWCFPCPLCPPTLWWFPVWKSTRKTGWSLGTYKTSWYHFEALLRAKNWSLANFFARSFQGPSSCYFFLQNSIKCAFSVQIQ